MSYKTPELRRNYEIARRKLRADTGLCRSCDNPRLPDRLQCAACTAARCQADKAKRAKNKAANGIKVARRKPAKASWDHAQPELVQRLAVAMHMARGGQFSRKLGPAVKPHIERLAFELLASCEQHGITVNLLPPAQPISPQEPNA